MGAVLAERLEILEVGPRPTFAQWWGLIEEWCLEPAGDAGDLTEEFNLLAGWWSPTGKGSYVLAWAPEGLDDRELFWMSLQRDFKRETPTATYSDGRAGGSIEAWFPNSPAWEALATEPSSEFIDRSGGAPAFDYLLTRDHFDWLRQSDCLRTAAQQPVLGLGASNGAWWLWPDA